MISSNINNRQFDSFVETLDGSTARLVQDVNDWVAQGIGNKIEFDRASAPTVVVTYKQGVTTVKQYTIVYTDSTENYIVSIERTA